MKNLVGVFETPARAEAVVHELVRRGVPREEISLLHSDAGRVVTEAPGGVPGEEATGHGDQRTADGTTMSQNIAGGALFGGIGGLLIGLGALAIPGIGPVIAAGPLAATLAGAGFGALGGGLIGAIKDLGVPDEDAQHYAERIERGDTLVSVRVPDEQVAEVKRLMDGLEAAGIEERGEDRTIGAPPADFAQARAHYEARGNDAAVIPVPQEELNVGSRAVDRGGIRMQGHAAEQLVARPVEAAESHMAQRQPADRLVVDVPLHAFEEGTIEFRERSEQPVIMRNVRLVEQVVVGTETTRHTETVRDTVRHTDVSVERVDALGTVHAHDVEFRRHHATTVGDHVSYEHHRPAYHFGHEAGEHPDYRGREFTAVEPQLRQRFEREHPGSLWEQVKGAVRHAFDRGRTAR